MGDMLILSCRQYLPGTVDDLQPGFKLSQCIVCKKEVQVSPRSIPLLEGGTDVFCNVCAVKLIEKHPEIVDLAMTPEAHAQLERLIAKMKAESQ